MSQIGNFKVKVGWSWKSRAMYKFSGVFVTDIETWALSLFFSFKEKWKYKIGFIHKIYIDEETWALKLVVPT